MENATIEYMTHYHEYEESTCVSLENFFSDNHYKWTFAMNLNFGSSNAIEFFGKFIHLRNRKDVQDIYFDIQKSFQMPTYSDETAIVISSMNKNELRDFFGKQIPMGMYIIDEETYHLLSLPKIEENMKPYALKWE